MNEINFEIKDVETINLAMDVGIKEIYPPIENLEVTPTKQKQLFTHDNSYGYDNVTVDPIPEEYIIPDGTLPITENTTYDVRRFARVTASVHPTPNLQDKEVTPTKETQTVTSDDGYDGLNNVTVNPIPNEYVIPNLQNKSITITENGIQTITPDESYSGLNSVEITTNVGGSTSPTTYDELKEGLLNLADAFIKYQFEDYVNTYPTYKNEPVTLYTPIDTNVYYVIRKKTNQKYQAMWFPYTVMYGTSGSFTTADYVLPDLYVKYNGSYYQGTSFIALAYRKAYVSGDYETLEDCIEAMQSPNTTYTTTTNNSFSCIAENGSIVPCTNIPVFTSILNTTLIPSKKISLNETIEVIPTE